MQKDPEIITLVSSIEQYTPGCVYMHVHIQNVYTMSPDYTYMNWDRGKQRS